MPLVVPAGGGRLVVPAEYWGEMPGTDFVLVPGGSHLAASGVGHALADFGWTTTSLSVVAGSAADFLASGDVGVVRHFLTNASADLLQSPVVFGDYHHGRLAQAILTGVPDTTAVPNALTAEILAAFSVNSANETASGFGFIEDAGAPGTADDHLAFIFSDGTNFGLRSGAASDAGAAVDTAWHRWTIRVTSANVEWFIDGTSQGTIALEADEFPVSFGMTVSTTNRVLLGPVRIWYS